MRMPDAVHDCLPAGVKSNACFYIASECNWNALCKCFPTEAEAIAAVQESNAVILPYGADSPVSGFVELSAAVDRSANIAGCYEVLQSKLGDDTTSVISRNPGILGCDPSQLEEASGDDIRRTTSVASGISSAFAPLRNFLKSTDWWDEDAGKPPSSQQKAESKPGSGGSDGGLPFDLMGFGAKPTDSNGGEDDGDEVTTVELPEVVIDGTKYMYDLRGEVFGVEHTLIDMEGEPVGIWNIETYEAEPVTFVDEEEEEE